MIYDEAILWNTTKIIVNSLIIKWRENWTQLLTQNIHEIFQEEREKTANFSVGTEKV